MRGAIGGVVFACGVFASACDPTPVPRAATAAAATSGGAQSERAVAHDPPDLVRAGRARFEAACGRCHGGDADAGTLQGMDLTRERFEAALHAGSDDGGLLPALSPADLPDDQVPALRAYLRSIGALRAE